MNEFIQVSITAPTLEDANTISKLIVEKRLAACVQIFGPIKSTYWWKDNIEESEEWMLVMKTRKLLFAALEKAVKDVHPYEVPEMIAVPIIEGSKDYLNWITEETEKKNL